MTDRWTLLAAQRPRLYRLARRRTLTREDAEDVVSETLVRCAAFPNLDPARVGPLTTAVAVRLCADLARRRAVELRAVPRLHVPSPDLTERLLDVEEARWLRTLSLTGIEAAALAARADGLLPADIAALLGVSSSSAKSALARARRKLLAAWRATLGVIGALRLRRMVPAGGAAVLAAAVAVTMLSLCPPEKRASAEVRAWQQTAVRPPIPATRTVITPPAVRARPPAIAKISLPRAREEVGTPVVRLRPVDAGAAGQGGVEVHVDTAEDPVDRVNRCLRNGVTIDVQSLSVVCRDS